MATDEEVLTAINGALDAATPADRRDTAKRTLIILKAALPLLVSKQESPPTPASPDLEAAVLVNLVPRSDAERAEIKDLNGRTLAVLKRLLAASEQPEQPSGSQTAPASDPQL